jgi:valyl-tRNA synthetase
MKLDSKRKVAADYTTQNPDVRDLIQGNLDPIRRLATLSEFRLSTAGLDPTSGVMRSTPLFELRIGFGEGIDIVAEVARLKKEIERLEKDIELKRARTQDQDFTSKAPPQVVKSLGIAMVERQIEQKKLKERLAQLQKGA